MKKLILILVPLLLIGTVIGLALMGIINIPGLSPKKLDWKDTLTKIFKAHGSVKGDIVILKGASKADTDAFVAAAKSGGLDPVPTPDGIKSTKLVALLGTGVVKPKPVQAKAPIQPIAEKTPAKPNVASLNKPELGVQAIAALWNSIEVEKLVKISEKYKAAELAKILIQMDQDHVAEFLAALEPKAAAALSREIQKQASIMPASPSPTGA